MVVRAEKPGTDPPKRFNPGWYVVRDNPELKGTDLKKPQQDFDQNNQPNVTFKFTGKGREQFQEVTRRIAQRGQAQAIPAPAQSSFQPFAIVLDGRGHLAPVHRLQPEPGRHRRPHRCADLGRLQRSQEAQDLANFLKTGALPVNLKPISADAGLGDRSASRRCTRA